MNRHLMTIAIIATITLGPTPGLTHHSITMFEKEKTITLTGVVKEFQYTNPHSWLIITVTGENGEKVNWGFEAEGPSTLLRAGIKKKDFLPGTKITITGRPMRNGRKAAYWVTATRLEDGMEFAPARGFVAR